MADITVTDPGCANVESQAFGRGGLAAQVNVPGSPTPVTTIQGGAGLAGSGVPRDTTANNVAGQVYGSGIGRGLPAEANH